jgi:hypothetical protein
MQLEFGYLASADPTPQVWDELDPDARRVFLHALARAIAQAVRPPGHGEHRKNTEGPHDR